MAVIKGTALTFDDVLLPPAASSVLPSETILRTKLSRNIQLSIPVVSAAMDTVTEASMAIAMAQQGGIGFLHRNVTIEEQAQMVRQVKRYEAAVVVDPATIGPDATIQELKAHTAELKISGMPVVQKSKVVGIVTSRDYGHVQDGDVRVADVMTPRERLITVSPSDSTAKAEELMYSNRIEKVLVLDKKDALRGMITLKDLNTEKAFPEASLDVNSRLLVGAAVGTGDTMERIEALVEQGIDVVCVDSAHGHSKNVLDTLTAVKKRWPYQFDLIGGNVATGAGAQAIIDCGVDAIKVGVGPGSICTTRVVTGIGVPQVTALMETVAVASAVGIPVISDGGIRYSGDIGKAVSAGAHCVMLGNLLAGTDEAPGELELYQGRSYKSYRGMGSLGAMNDGDGDRYMQSDVAPSKYVPEGIEGRIAYRGALAPVIHQLTGGLRQTMGYRGAADIDALMRDAEFYQMTSAGYSESHVHDVTITRETPNYRTS